MLSEQTREQAREIVARYPKPRSALLPLLHLVQSDAGYVTPEGIGMCAELLGLTKAEVGSVASFYTMFKRRPVGTYHVGVCTNTLCAVMGGDLIYDELKKHLGIEGQNGVSDDGVVSLEGLEALGDDPRADQRTHGVVQQHRAFARSANGPAPHQPMLFVQ